MSLSEDHREIEHLPVSERNRLLHEVTSRLFRRPRTWLLIAAGVCVSLIPTVVWYGPPNPMARLPGILVWLLPTTCAMAIQLGVWAVVVELRRPILRELLREQRIRPATCFGCGYDLRETRGDVCPECAQSIEGDPLTSNSQS